jgi:chromosome segregation ATPase
VDNFFNSLSDKVSAQEIIKANARAEAAEAERTRQEAEQYKAQLQELKENARQQKEAIDETRQSLASLSERMDGNETKIHDVGVQIYRNVQAVVEKGQVDVRKEFAALKEQESASFEDIKTKSEEEFRNLCEINEKAFKSLKEKNADQFKEIDSKFEQMLVAIESKNGALMPLLIITLLISAADLVINILRILGVL